MKQLVKFLFQIVFIKCIYVYSGRVPQEIDSSSTILNRQENGPLHIASLYMNSAGSYLFHPFYRIYSVVRNNHSAKTNVQVGK